ncbi:hypothetical protein MNBD_NITROSPINAE02-313 [hydrothermal vent metagenome]|uniref:shikimate kinase n=1 Tax=hydrothermal vent metagenome TaxID=652676 RepID=A0A3B1CHG8_9ZZZZ
MNLTDPIVVIGFKGCGKTLIGRLLAQKLNLEFTDTDSLIENLYIRREGEALSFREIFNKHGKKYFRDLEKEALLLAAKKKGHVVSLGGGSLGQIDGAMGDFKSASFVYLKVQKDVLYRRILKNGLPAFFDKEAPYDHFEKLFQEREPAYKKFANITVDNTDKKPEEVVRNILTALEKRESER